MFTDNHVHSRYSNCCHENHGLTEIARMFLEKGFPYACVTDHVHQQGEGGFLHHHLDARNALERDGYPLPVFVGIEASIQDAGGHLPLAGVRGPVDHVLAGDHWIPGTSISMASPPEGARTIKELHGRDPGRLQEIHERAARMYMNAVKTNHDRDIKVDVLVHPFDTFIRCNDFDKDLLEMLPGVCEVCRDAGVAIEINNASAWRCQVLFKETEPLHGDCLEPARFFEEMARIIVSMDCQVSFASDAHLLEEVGNISRATGLARRLGLKDWNSLDLRERTSRNRERQGA